MFDPIVRLTAALEGRYRIERELGEGGMATVYLADDLKHERKVAVKVLKPEVAAAVGGDRFLREIKTTASLQHPGILPLHDSGVADGMVYYVMPYVQGATLRDRIASEGALLPAEATRITSEVASALGYAHAQGVIHRDVKPANILLSQGHAVLADFGIAKALVQGMPEGLTKTAGTSGTVRYMSPEQMRGDPGLDGRSDQYALGCVVYEMLSGEPLFTGKSAWAVIARQVSGELQSLATGRSGMPVAADAVIARAVEADPADRYERVEDLAASLSAALESARPSAPLVTGPRAALAAIVVTVVALLAWFVRVPGDAGRLDPNMIVVFPLSDQRPAQADGIAGEQLAILVGTVLEHAEPLRWIDGWDWLEPELRADMSSWSIDRGLEIARERGARYVVDGRILGQADSAQVMLRLHDAVDGTLTRTDVQLGGADELTTLGQRAVVSLLPRLIDAGRAVPAGSVVAYAPAAVAAWLNGERDYRQSRFESALGHFRSAVQADSTMAIAALRGAQAARWLFENGEAGVLIDAALRREASLTPRQALLARGIRSYFDGAAGEAERHFQRAIDSDPTWSDAWMALGEVYYHLMPEVGSGMAQAEEAFRTAVENDPGFTPVHVHLAELAFRRGDAARGDSLRRVLPARGEDASLSTHLGLMSRCVRSEVDGTDWSDVSGTEEGGLAVLSAALHLGVGGAEAECSVEAFAALASWGAELAGGAPRRADMAWSTLLGAHGLHTARGDHEAVVQLMNGARQFARQQDYLWVVQAVAGTSVEQEVQAALRRLDRASAPSATALWSIGVGSALREDPESAMRAARTARERSRQAMDVVGSGAGESTRAYALLADVLDGWSALARADTSEAIERFSSVEAIAPPDQLEWTLWEPLAAEHLQLARLLLARGDFEGAIEAADYIDHPQPVVSFAYVAASLEVRIQAARAQGDGERADRYVARLGELRGRAG